MRVEHLLEREERIGFNELLAKLFGIDVEETFRLREQFHDMQIPWLNNNSEKAVDNMIKREDFHLLSKALFFKDFIAKESNYGKKVHTPEQFARSLELPIRLWRGGGGKYDPNFFDIPRNSWHEGKIRKWSAFTATPDRAKTFSIYDGTVGKQFLDKRRGPYWIVELTCKLDDILLYLHQGMDDEVIVSNQLAKKAKVIKQTK